MTKGIRGRIFTWLVIAAVPVLSVALVSTSAIETRIAERVADEMVNFRRLEASRIGFALDEYQIDADRLARATYVALFTEQVQQARDGETGGQVEGQGGFDSIDPSASDPLSEVAEALRVAALGAGTAVVEARVVDMDGNSLGQSAGYGWEPAQPELVRQVLDGAGDAFGSSYRAGPDEQRIGLVTAIRNPQDDIVGALLSEVDIREVTGLLEVHTEFSNTSEAFLVQRDLNGQARYLSALRFGDALTATPASATSSGAPIDDALRSPDGLIVLGRDYRGVESVFAVETIESTGWGLVIRIDSDEAFEISSSIRRLVLLGSLLGVIALFVGWALLLRPLVARIRTTAAAADRVASGDYTSRIDDGQHDEIGEVARGIDRLAADLEFDIRMRNDVERRLRYQATHDELTNIFNRQHMTALIRDSLSSGEDQSVTLLFLDLDDFKLVNDLWGHAVGDEVLTAVANRLRRLTDDGIFISRWGGDEFTVVQMNADSSTTNALANRVRSLFAQPINTSVGPSPVACSVGVATAYSGDDIDQLLHDADAKMFLEKQSNRKSRMIDPDTARLVEMALADGRVEVHYQPIVELISATETRLHALEALVRIRATDGTLHQPSDFLSEVMSHRYANEIDRTIAMIAMNDLVEWRIAGLAPEGFSIALNLSPASMRDPSLDQTYAAIAAKAGIEPQSIILELSEEADDLPVDVAEGLQSVGFRLAVDDLGLKRSNLDRLLNGRVDIGKLDRRWLDEPAVFEALTRTCEDRDITVICEGVETNEQLQMAFDVGVRLCQGYLIARPMPASEILKMLSGSRASATV